MCCDIRNSYKTQLTASCSWCHSCNRLQACFVGILIKLLLQYLFVVNVYYITMLRTYVPMVWESCISCFWGGKRLLISVIIYFKFKLKCWVFKFKNSFLRFSCVWWNLFSVVVLGVLSECFEHSWCVVNGYTISKIYMRLVSFGVS